jgi:hypothetical protein
MHPARQHPRITDTQDLLANLRSLGRSPRASRVLNLSEGGMLVAGNDLAVGETTRFELSGATGHYAGVAEVAHLTNGSTGLRFLSWQGQADRPVRSLIDARSEWAVSQTESRGERSVIRRVAVLVGPQRPSRPDVSSS